MSDISLSRATVNDVELAYLEVGDGPLALCLHGFPDTAHTWRHLMAPLAAAGYRAVAPFNRGYHPSGPAGDGSYQSGALGADANGLHQLLGGDDDAVLIGHDWGALAAYGASASEPQRWRRVVTMAVPPGPAMAEGLFTYEQLRCSWYMFFFQFPLADAVLAADDHDFVAKLWADWSPGYDATVDLDHWRAAMPDPANVAAALDCYRHTVWGGMALDRYADTQNGSMAPAARPTLYLHGRNDGCVRAEIAERSAIGLPVEGSRVEMVEGAGHFLHLERPEAVNALVLDFLAG